MVLSMAFLCVALISAYTSKEVIGQDSPLWVDLFAGFGLLGFVICLFVALFGSRSSTSKD